MYFILAALPCRRQTTHHEITYLHTRRVSFSKRLKNRFLHPEDCILPNTSCVFFSSWAALYMRVCHSGHLLVCMHKALCAPGAVTWGDTERKHLLYWTVAVVDRRWHRQKEFTHPEKEERERHTWMQHACLKKQTSVAFWNVHFSSMSKKTKTSLLYPGHVDVATDLVHKEHRGNATFYTL